MSYVSGGSYHTCSWGRQKSLCCQVSKPLPPPLVCELTTCDIDPWSCDDDDGESIDVPEKRDLVDSIFQSDQKGDVSILEKRYKERPISIWLFDGRLWSQTSLAYVLGSWLWRRARENGNNRYYALRSQQCDNAQVEPRPITEGDLVLPKGQQVEHRVPLSTSALFIASCNHGRMWNRSPKGKIIGGKPSGQLTPEGRRTRTPAIRSEFWRNVWNDANALPAGLPPVTPTSPEMRRPADRIYEALGSATNLEPLTFLDGAINRAKGCIEGYKRPMSEKKLKRYLRNANQGTDSQRQLAVQTFLAPLRETRGVFQYLRDVHVYTTMDNIVSTVYRELRLIEEHIFEARGISDHWTEWYPYYFSEVSAFARDWAAEHIATIRTFYRENPTAGNRDQVLKELVELEDSVKGWKYMFEDQ
ncbi:hypothetical protein PG996_000001 [Apiospora saccharicola]|uniref:Uncharacterized protein n=1 Tax=Apiospora saccharicola TaxID=335842 RepID=A0ABR1WCH4_9PEZI